MQVERVKKVIHTRKQNFINKVFRWAIVQDVQDIVTISTDVFSIIWCSMTMIDLNSMFLGLLLQYIPNSILFLELVRSKSLKKLYSKFLLMSRIDPHNI